MKTRLSVVTIGVIVLIGGCATFFPGDTPVAPAYQVGDRGPAGGVIIFDKGVLTDRWRYLEAAPEDLDQVMRWYDATQVAREWRTGDYADWRVPTRAELAMMYEQRSTIGGFSPYGYWSATEDGAGRAWKRYFDDGHEASVYKYTYSRIRAVRSF